MAPPTPPGRVCHACQTVQATPGRFCVACGTALEMGCRACGAALPEHATFCPACGQRHSDPHPPVAATPSAAPLAPPSPAPNPPAAASLAERKPLSVLCAHWDAALVRHWHLDDLPEHLTALRAWVEQVMEPFGGTLLELESTGMVVGFGVPVAQEEHALRALGAALTLRHRAAEMPLGGPEPLEVRRHVRLAVSSGVAVVSPASAPSAQLGHILGEVRPEAQRLAGQAQPGTVVVNAEMARLISPMTTLEPPYRPAEEAATPEVYRVMSDATALWSRPLRHVHLSSPFVGRAADLALLHTQWAKARQGQGQIVTLVAEAGMGKSRLLHEFYQRLAGQQVPYLTGRCQPYGLTALYEPFLDVVRQCCQLPSRGETVEVRQAIDQSLQALHLDAATWGPYLAHLVISRMRRPRMPA